MPDIVVDCEDGRCSGSEYGGNGRHGGSDYGGDGRHDGCQWRWQT